MCIVKLIKEYLCRTKCLSADEFFFISFKKTYKKVSKDTVARWIKETMAKPGINTTVFKAHSTRSASTSTVAHKRSPKNAF